MSPAFCFAMIWVSAAVSAPLQPVVTLWPLFVLLFIFLGVTIWLTKRNENKFLQQARKIIEANDDLSYDDIHNISQSWNIERERLLHLLRALLGEAMAEKTEASRSKVDAIRKLVRDHLTRTPYSELPENIGLQLTGLSTAYPAASPQISQLAGSLSELYSKNQRELKKQKAIAVWSFVVTIVSLIVAITIPLLPHSSNSLQSGAASSATPTP